MPFNVAEVPTKKIKIYNKTPLLIMVKIPNTCIDGEPQSCYKPESCVGEFSEQYFRYKREGLPVAGESKTDFYNKYCIQRENYIFHETLYFDSASKVHSKVKFKFKTKNGEFETAFTVSEITKMIQMGVGNLQEITGYFTFTKQGRKFFLVYIGTEI